MMQPPGKSWNLRKPPGSPGIHFFGLPSPLCFFVNDVMKTFSAYNSLYRVATGPGIPGISFLSWIALEIYEICQFFNVKASPKSSGSMEYSEM